MQLKEVFAKEQSRKELVDYRTIYLIPEGTFYRAYEQGAKNQEQGAKSQDKNVKTDIGIDEIVRRVLAYPIEQHSPMEAVAFLSEIKQQLSERVTIS